MRHLIVHRERHVLLKVLQPLGDVLLDAEREAELVNLLLVGQLAQDGGPAAVLQVHKVPLEHAQRHLCFGGRTAHNRVERLDHLMEAGEGHAEADAVLEVGQRAGHPVKVEPDGGGNVLLKTLDVLLVAAAVPEEALVAEAPAGLVLTQHVDKPREPRRHAGSASDDGKRKTLCIMFRCGTGQKFIFKISQNFTSDQTFSLYVSCLTKHSGRFVATVSYIRKNAT